MYLSEVLLDYHVYARAQAGESMRIVVKGRWLLYGCGNDRKVIKNGGLCIDEGIVIDIGTYEDILHKHRADEVIGSERHLIMPGLVNSHNHGMGLSTIQKGMKAEPLEIRVHTYARHLFDVDTYYDTLLSAIKQIESGITCTTNHHYSVDPTDFSEYMIDLEKSMQGWIDSGMRVVFAPIIQNQNKYVYGNNEDFISKLPREVRKRFVFSENTSLGAKNYFKAFENLFEDYQGYEGRVNVHLGPSGPQWCSDDLLEKIRDVARRKQTGIHIHLLQTLYEKQYALNEYGKTMVEHLNELDFLGPNVCCVHCNYLTKEDIRTIAQTRSAVVHNPSANLKLYGGVAPVLLMKKRGVQLSLGTDGNGLNDDEDMFQEMRLCQILHRAPGIAAKGLDSNEILEMATVGGGKATRFVDVGTLEIGKKADVILVDMERAFYSPFMSKHLSVQDVILQRVKALDVDTVIINGEIVMKNKRFTRLNKKEVLGKVERSVKQTETQTPDAEAEKYLKELKQHIASFFAKWNKHAARAQH